MGTIDEIFEWVDSYLMVWANIIQSEQDQKPLSYRKLNNILARDSIELKKWAHKSKIRFLETFFASASEYSCEYVIKRLMRNSRILFDDYRWPNEHCWDTNSYEGIKTNIFFELTCFYSSLYVLGTELGHNIQEYCKSTFPELITEECIIRDYFIPMENKPYPTLPRTHRIAAVKELIRKSGLCRNIDDTRISAFVEAVTGGNIEAKGGNTISYKTPTKEAQNAAVEWLKKIGIE